MRNRRQQDPARILDLAQTSRISSPRDQAIAFEQRCSLGRIHRQIRRCDNVNASPTPANTRPCPPSTVTSARSGEAIVSSPTASTMIGNRLTLRLLKEPLLVTKTSCKPGQEVPSPSCSAPEAPRRQLSAASASARRWRASVANVVLRSAITAMVQPTMTNKSRATTFSRSLMLKLPTGGTKNQLTRNVANSDATSADSKPPISVQPMTAISIASRTNVRSISGSNGCRHGQQSRAEPRQQPQPVGVSWRARELSAFRQGHVMPARG